MFPVKVRRGVEQKQAFVSPSKQMHQYVTTPTVQTVVVLFLQTRPLEWFANKERAGEVAMKHYSSKKC